tara:strand:+ start:398 stop:583 length:186 start_codon:yes stop_codon:yes gene_type:complete
MINQVAQLQATRRYITSVLLNVDMKPSEMQLDTFLNLLDAWIQNPEQYKELTDANNKRFQR